MSARKTQSFLYRGEQKKSWVLFYKKGTRWVGVDISTLRPYSLGKHMKCGALYNTIIYYKEGSNTKVKAFEINGIVYTLCV